MDRNPTAVITRCNELKRFWSPRNEKMKSWYKMIQMVDELKTEKMESFVGNDPRSMYNLVLHMLDVKVPHRIEEYDLADLELANAVAEVGKFFTTAWQDVADNFRHTNPRQSLNRARIGFLLATGWYSEFAIVADNGERCIVDVWNPIETYPMWDGDMGLSEVAHMFQISPRQASNMSKRYGWQYRNKVQSNTIVHDYWWTELSDMFPFILAVWNAIVIDGDLVKFERTRFKKMPIYVAPVGGLPDMGSLTEGSQLSTTFQAGAVANSERWKEDLGQAIIATNEHIYRTWNKWWSFSLQLLRDTAQPRIFERSRSGQAIVRPEEVFRRGAIFRGGPDDAVEFIGTPPMPLELRSTQLDLEAMMQRGGVSWAMYGNVTGQLTSYVMSQIAASANQVMFPFHQALVNLNEDIDNDWLRDVKERGIKPYGWTYPSKLPDNIKVSAEFEVEIPGDLVQRATVARMLDPDFRLSYSYVISKLFPEIKDKLKERAQVLSDMAQLHPTNAAIALIQYYRKQAQYLEKIGDSESARLFNLAADAAMAQLGVEEQEQAAKVPGMGRPEAIPRQLQQP